MRKNQRTLQKPATLEGPGLFSGVPCRVTLRPAAADSGIVFVRADLPQKPRLRVSPDSISPKLRRSAVTGEGGAEVETTEHLLSALAGMGVDAVEVELTAAELPNTDGSGKPWVDLVLGAGLQDLPEPRKIHVIREPISVTDNDATIAVLPGGDGLTISYTLDYPGTRIGRQHYTLELTDEAYASQIAPARTFCLQSEAEALQAQGMAKGATFETAVVWGPDGPIQNTPRFPDEPVRHKILDLVGDLASLGAGLKGHVVAVKSGHGTNLKLVKKIAASFTDAGQVAAPRGQTSLLDVREIAKILPHRFPFLLVDRVVELDGYRRAVGIKNVTFNEPFFQGHFPEQPIMPGVLQIEAMAQLAGVLLMRKSDNQAKVAVLLSLDGVKLRKNVVPGDQLRLEVETLKIKARTGEVFARATVDGQLVAEANMKFMLLDG
jgi:UDP-3-O-[3-hydroxymyristoyl] N-acetylglucosamine deacetylase/3-hydroxyacyl-[acyl-carrier-protein] dehydratase